MSLMTEYTKFFPGTIWDLWIEMRMGKYGPSEPQQQLVLLTR
jgi:hypothetical protein